MKIKTLLVDDEALARRRLRELLAEHQDIEVVGECSTGAEVVERLKEQPCDLLLLDIQMPRLSGVMLTNMLGEEPLPLVVFVTAHDSFAVEAFDTRAIDYLLKPVRPERLGRSLDRARAQLQAMQADPVTKPERSSKEAGQIQRLVAKSGDRAVIIDAPQIDWIESAGNYVVVQCGDHRHIIRETMAALETGLPAQHFVRLNRSLIVGIDRIVELNSEGNGEYSATLKDGRKANVTIGLRELERRLKYVR